MANSIGSLSNYFSVVVNTSTYNCCCHGCIPSLHPSPKVCTCQCLRHPDRCALDQSCAFKSMTGCVQLQRGWRIGMQTMLWSGTSYLPWLLFIGYVYLTINDVVLTMCLTSYSPRMSTLSRDCPSIVQYMHYIWPCSCYPKQHNMHSLCVCVWFLLPACRRRHSTTPGCGAWGSRRGRPSQGRKEKDQGLRGWWRTWVQMSLTSPLSGTGRLGVKHIVSIPNGTLSSILYSAVLLIRAHWCHLGHNLTLLCKQMKVFLDPPKSKLHQKWFAKDLIWFCQNTN